jgi:hypothetical protein
MGELLARAGQPCVACGPMKLPSALFSHPGLPTESSFGVPSLLRLLTDKPLRLPVEIALHVRQADSLCRVDRLADAPRRRQQVRGLVTKAHHPVAVRRRTS